MNRKEFEIDKSGKEVFKNNRYSQLPTLTHIVSDNQKILDQLMSVKIAGNRNLSADQYNIETNQFITNITTHNGLDLHLLQFNKKEKTTEMYSPYSSPGYEVFTHLLLAYYEAFKKRPHINFIDMDIQSWNDELGGLHNPLSNNVQNIWFQGNVFGYLNYKEDMFKQDSNGITRVIFPREEDNQNDREGFGIHGDNTVIQFKDYMRKTDRKSKIIFENDLIPLYLQAFIDTNRCVAGPRNVVNLKKIYEMIYYVLENKKPKEEFDLTQVRKNTPII